MKKVISAILVLMLCVAMPLSIFASADEFVPSISYKDAPEVVGATLDGEDIGDALVVTSVLTALNGSVADEATALLLEVYEQLSKNEAELPVDGTYVVRDLFDVSLLDEAKQEKLASGKYTVDVVFNVAYSENLVVMNFDGKSWNQVEVIDNGNGTVTCRFSHFSPVAFLELGEGASVASAGAKNVGLWIALGIVVLGGGAAVVYIYRRKIFR